MKNKLKSILLNPRKVTDLFEDKRTKKLFQDTVDYFENKGKTRILKDVLARRDNEDWFKYQGEKKIYASLLTPKGYGKEDSSFDLSKIRTFSELIAFYDPSHWYSFQVSILGVCPIWMGNNEKQKNELATQLQEGHIFAFGLSEKEHGANIYATETTITPLGNGKYRADGNKYYIGNAYIAPKISTLGKNTETGEWSYFVIDSRHKKFNYVKHIETGLTGARVGEYTLVDYPLTDDDIFETGKEAFNKALLTVNIGKYMVACASIGFATHSFYEAITHSNRRRLYDGMRVTDFPHIQQFFNESFCRLNAMELYSRRGIDYMRVLSKKDRRYLLFNPIKKMKVAVEAEKSMNLIMDIVCAKGYEADTYLSQASVIVPYMCRLEGTVHVNMSLILKFIKGYFFINSKYPEIKTGNYNKDDSNVLHKQKFGKLATIGFPDYRKVYEGIELKNVKKFSELVELFKEMLEKAPADDENVKNMDYMLNVGQIFTQIVYAQLVLEQALISNIHDELIEQIFSIFIKDVTKYTLEQLNYQENTDKQNEFLRKMLSITPVLNKKREVKFFKEFIQILDGQYIMNGSVIGA